MEAKSVSYCSLCLKKAGTSFQSRETDLNPSSSGVIILGKCESIPAQCSSAHSLQMAAHSTTGAPSFPLSLSCPAVPARAKLQCFRGKKRGVLKHM